jgi:two-component system sensor histidine kinase ChvG
VSAAAGARRPRRRLSVRAIIYAGAVGLALLPLVLVAIAYGYEQSLVRDLEARLHGVAAQLVAGEPAAAVAKRERVEVVVLDAGGAVVADSGTGELALSSSLLGSFTEWLLAGVEELRPGEPLSALEHAFGPLAARDEVVQALHGHAAFAQRLSPSAHTVLFALATPRPEGGVVYVEKGSRRGIRRLIVLRGELVKLAAYEVLFAALFAALLGHRVATPLGRLARAARRYPSEPLADPRLLARGDELGDVARAITALAADLDQRRRHAADLGADVAHEFKNPLATIAASAELIGAARQDSPEKRGLVASHILEAVERLRRSIDALLALLRLEVSLPDERRERVDYAAFLEEMLDEYRRDPRWAAVELRARVAADAAAVTVVRGRWAELVRNLVDNALVQPAARPAVLIEVTRAGDTVVTRVCDRGPGVSAGNRDNIFRRFYSVRPSGAPPGTGLGLSIASAIAAAHGGRVALEPATGEGAVFAVTLPDAPT